MSIPLIVTAPVFVAADATETKTLKSINTEFQKCVSLIYEVDRTGFSGTLDFQTATPPGGTSANSLWTELDSETSADARPSNDQISWTADTGRNRYLVPISGVEPRVVMTRSAGTVTVNVTGYGVPLASPVITVIGSRADGSSVASAGRPVLVAGQDGTNVQTLLTETTGRLDVALHSNAASVVKTVRAINISSTTRATVLTPTSGKAARILSVNIVHEGTTSNGLEVYFSTGANITTTAGKEITEERAASIGTYAIGWNDGAGPVGAVNDVISMRGTASVAENVTIIVTYREE